MRRAACVATLAVAIVTGGAASAQEEAAPDSRWQAGLVQILNWGGPDTRAGDILGLGLFATYRWNDRWSQTFGVDRLEYDLETPVLALSLGELSGDEAADSFITVLRLQSELEHHFRRGGRWDPYAAFGLGYYTLDAGEVRGRGRSGAPYLLEIDTPNTVGATVRLGSDWALGRRVRLGASLSYSQTFQDYTVTDRITGEKGEIKAFAPLGIATRIGFRF